MIEYQPISKVSLSAAYYYGQTQTPKGNSLITMGDLISDGFSFEARYDLEENKMLGMTFSSPLKIKKGEARLRLPYGRDLYSDTVYYDEVRLNLRPEAREYDVGVYYQSANDRYRFRGEVMTRFNPEHRANAKPDYRAICGLDWMF